MEKERICYYCKKAQLMGAFGINYQCSKAGEYKESFDTCNDWEDSEE